MAMHRLQIPYNKVLMNPADFDPAEFDSLLRHFLDVSRKLPVVLEVFNDYIQFYLFIRDGQLYYVATNNGEEFNGITLKEFFSNLKRTQFPKIVVYHTKMILYHSLLIYMQKKPDLKVSSSLVDLDDLLDTTEHDEKSVLVTACHSGNLIMIRYQGGEAVACYHAYSEGKTKEANIREEFLVKVYTLSTHNAFEINIFTDLVVVHAEDARPIPPDYYGTISSFFLTQRPRLVVKLKNRPIKTYPFHGNEVSVGRLPQNDVVIDNLSVSRRHAVITRASNGYTLSDLGSKNGTFLNGKPVEKAELSHGDTITIGKYQIVFQIPCGEEDSVDSLDQTVIIPNFRQKQNKDKFNIRFPVPDGSPPKIYRRSNHDEFVLDRERTVIGKGKESDIQLSGIFAPKVKIEITRQGSDYVMQKIEGRKKVNVNGEEMDEKVLEEEDLIAIGSEEFVFKH
jgi:pSer/pThr/pTyr-binding forkhead associated (FHA) protein